MPFLTILPRNAKDSDDITICRRGADDSFFLCRALVPGYLDGITGVYKTPQGYYVDDAGMEIFDKA